MSDTYIEVRTQVRMAQWQNIIKECRESGMSVSEFCEERSISSHAYYYWLRKIREYITEADTSPKFVQLPAAAKPSPPSQTGSITIRAGGLAVEVEGNVNHDALKAVLMVIKEI